MQFVMMVALAAAVQNVGMISPGGMEAIGPKQDDPLACPSGAESIGPKQDDPRQGIVVQGGRKLAIGPKQDDPLKRGVLARPGDDEDPHAAGGAEAIGPKQDDPLMGRKLAIGPKQDDPRSPGTAAVGTYDPETDPQALKAVQGKCGKPRL
ncbi:MAG TPA: hypothetical protein VFO45_06240 [Sphingomicrobium sp.]|nr:hypothetical protein [Sphingomicrobium sp.]